MKKLEEFFIKLYLFIFLYLVTMPWFYIVIDEFYKVFKNHLIVGLIVGTIVGISLGNLSSYIIDRIKEK